MLFYFCLFSLIMLISGHLITEHEKNKYLVKAVYQVFYNMHINAILTEISFDIYINSM